MLFHSELNFFYLLHFLMIICNFVFISWNDIFSSFRLTLLALVFDVSFEKEKKWNDSFNFTVIILLMNEGNQSVFKAEFKKKQSHCYLICKVLFCFGRIDEMSILAAKCHQWAWLYNVVIQTHNFKDKMRSKPIEAVC